MPSLFSAALIAMALLAVIVLGTNLWALRLAATMTAADEERAAP